MTARGTVLRTALVAGAVIAADQATKALVRAEISRFEEVELVLGAKLINTRNTGVAFSLFSGGGPDRRDRGGDRAHARCWRSSSRTCAGG